MILCDWCEQSVPIVARVDTIERGEGFTYDVCRVCLSDLRVYDKRGELALENVEEI